MSVHIPWIDAQTPLPPASAALPEPPGLVAAGLDLSVWRLEQAYRQGIFPWFNPGEPVLWWSPDPRTVLFCEELRISRSLGKRLRAIARRQSDGDLRSCVVTVDRAFSVVIEACATRGKLNNTTDATWITPEIKQVYQQWHVMGRAHSIETWMDGELAGGLYGVSLGQMFFGESMFTRRTDASKIALVHLVRFLARRDVKLIDCQMATSHLASLGARSVDRRYFIDHVQRAIQQPDLDWAPGWIDGQGALHQA